MCDPNYCLLVIKGENTINIESSVATPSMIESTNLFASDNIYLQTPVAFIPTDYNENSLICQVLDGGSQLSFIKECVSRKVNLPVVGSHKISIFPFGITECSPL